jgi:hypothetical protein
MGLTFVTAFLNMKEERPSCRKLDTYVSLFQNIIDSDVQLHVYLSPDYYEMFKDKFTSDNVVVESIRLEDLRVYKELSTIQVELPAVRNGDKDTYNFLTLINSKTELMQKSVHNNVFNSTHFAWIDFGIFHIVKNTESVKHIIHKLSTTNLKDSFLCAAGGCRPKPHVDFSNLFWRFFGGFFIGDKESVLQFDKLYETTFMRIVKQYKILTWEVNVWGFFEQFLNWKPIVYVAGFNDTMFENIPFDKISRTLY